MTRLIPGKTNVNIELFRGVSLWDLLVGAGALAMVIFVLFSSLPWRWGLALVIVMIAVFLLVRIDGQPNYVFVGHLLSFLGYKRNFDRVQTDETLIRVAAQGERAVAMEELFSEEPEKTDGSGREPEAPVLSAKEQKRIRRQEDKLLKSSKVPEEEKQRILERRFVQDREAAAAEAERKEKRTAPNAMSEIIPFTGIRDGFIEYLNGSYFGAVLEIDPVEFRFFSEERRTASIQNCFGRILRTLNPKYAANIVKIERPIDYDLYLDREYSKLDRLRASYENGVLSEEELKARVEVEYDRINELIGYCNDNKIVTQFYYFVLFDSDKRQLESSLREARQALEQGELTVRRLDDKEIAVFLKYTNSLDFDPREADSIRPEDLHTWAQPEVVDIRSRRVEINHVVTHNFRVAEYPSSVGDAWLAGVLTMPGTKAVVKISPMDRTKAIRNIDRSLMELRGQWSATGIDSRRLELENHIASLQELLNTLSGDMESLLEVNVYITAYDIVATRSDTKLVQPGNSYLPSISEMKRTVRRTWNESGFRLNNMDFDQVRAFIGSQVSGLDPMLKDGRGMPSNTVAACFPWIYAHISDEGGIKLGESDGIPVFIDLFRRDSERVNGNMVIVGRSGSGKSYAAKSLLTNLAAEEAKIFILDPENEYTDLAANLKGQVINVGNAQQGRLNPFQIITALDDDETGENEVGNSYATHLQFLEEFFKQIMPDCERDAMEYLNTLVDHMYLERGITQETDLSKLTPGDYPIFDDLYDQVLQEFQSTDNPFTRDMLRTLMNYVAKFSTGGRNANIWNGPSTITTDENFTVFNFQAMLANRNTTIANAQMLLVLKYIDNEIIKNRDYNTRYKANRKVVIVIDEAHVFIDAKFPIALDFMYQLAKRIRKYNGIQIVITQNIKDFVGSEEISRKSEAIINACQYSFIFSLAPNDMQDLVKLYEKAGGINESEQNQIIQAARGQAFVILSPTSRSSFTVETAAGLAQMFEEQDYRSRYFSGEQGAENWADFIGDSSQNRMRTALLDMPADIGTGEDDGNENGNRSGSVLLQEFDEDEFEQYRMMNTREEAEDRTPEWVEEKRESDEDTFSPIEDIHSIPADTEPVRGGNDVFSLIADALSRMADAVEHGSLPGAAASVHGASASEGPEIIAAGLTADMARLLQEKEDEIFRLRSEMEAAEQKTAVHTQSEMQYAPAEEPEEELPEETGAFDGLDDDAFGEEGDGELLDLFGGLDDDLYDEEEAEEDGDAYGDELSTFAGLDDDEEEDDEDGEEDAGSEEEEEDEEDFMASFCRFAESLQAMSLFEQMNINGEQVREITLDELIRETKLKH